MGLIDLVKSSRGVMFLCVSSVMLSSVDCGRLYKLQTRMCRRVSSPRCGILQILSLFLFLFFLVFSLFPFEIISSPHESLHLARLLRPLESPV